MSYDPAFATKTYASRLAEGKKLADGNAVLKQEKEILEREIRDLNMAKAEIIKNTGALPADYEKVKKEHFKKIEECENRAVIAKTALQDAEKLLVDKVAIIEQIASREANLRASIKVLESDIKILTERKDNLDKTCAEARNEYEFLIKEKSRELTLLNDAVTSASEAKIIVSREMDQRMAVVVEQERLASIRRTDLEIYEARLRAKYPNETIVL